MVMTMMEHSSAKPVLAALCSSSATVADVQMHRPLPLPVLPQPMVMCTCMHEVAAVIAAKSGRTLQHTWDFG